MTTPGRRRSFSDRRAERAAVDDPRVVLDAALRFLEARQRSTSEVRRRLRTAGYRDELIEGAVARLGELGFLDDDSFARAWVESRDHARPRGERALRAELRQKGIGPETVDAVLDVRAAGDSGGDGGGAELEAALRLLDRRGRGLERVADPRARRQRAYALLARNGFDAETATRAVSLRFEASQASADQE